MANPVLIVGAGPVGLTMAAALNQRGVACRLIDKAPSATDKSKALVVWCRTMELLDGLGLADTFLKHGRKLRGGSMYAGGERLVHLNLTSDESPFGFPLMVPQNVTERLLTEHLTAQGVTVERPVELVSMVDHGHAVACRLRHADGREEEVETPWLLGCDGAHSTVRHALGLEFTGEAEPNDWMLADVHIDGPLADDEVSVYWHDRGVVAFFPINDDRFRMIADLGTAGDVGARPELTLAEAQAKVDERGPRGLTLSDPVWLSYFRIHERKVDEYRKGRVMLAGDAAHIHSPAGGQGMNTGMQDAFNLAWKLALIEQGQGRTEPLLESYSVERSAIGERVLRNAERFTTMATLRSPVAQWLRNHLVPVLGSFSFVQDKIRNEWFELSVNYRHSPLVRDVWPALTGGLAAGDRMCEAPLVSAADWTTTTLFTQLRGQGHVLLLLAGSEGDAEELIPIASQAHESYSVPLSCHLIVGARTTRPSAIPPHLQVWVDADEVLHRKLHASRPTILLIRPDGYIGFRCQPADGQKLHEFLGTYLVGRG